MRPYRMLVLALSVLAGFIGTLGSPASLPISGGAPALVHQPRLEDGVLRLGDARVVDGASVDTRGARVELRLSAIGREGALWPTASSPAEVSGRDVRIARGHGVTEWYRSLPRGLEQGVTIEQRPDGEGELVLDIGVGAQVRVRSDGPGQVILTDARTGARLARYSELAVLDARGERLDARLFAAGDRIRIAVDDRGARYPVVVDPLLSLFEEARLTAAPAREFQRLGSSVATDATGLVLVSGAPNDGSFHVFERMGSSWSSPTRLAPPGVDPSGMPAASVSDDGMRILLGTPQPSSVAGAARVFRRDGPGSWSEEAVLTAAGACAVPALAGRVRSARALRWRLACVPGRRALAGRHRVRRCHPPLVHHGGRV